MPATTWVFLGLSGCGLFMPSKAFRTMAFFRHIGHHYWPPHHHDRHLAMYSKFSTCIIRKSKCRMRRLGASSFGSCC